MQKAFSLRLRPPSLPRSSAPTATATGATYYIELDPTNYYTATSGTFIGAEFSLFGMRDIADPASHGSRYPQSSPEYILKEDPDYVFLADTVCCGVDAANFAAPAGLQRAQGSPASPRRRRERLGCLAVGLTLWKLS